MKTYLERLTPCAGFTVGKLYEIIDDGVWWVVHTDDGTHQKIRKVPHNWRTHQVGTLKEIGARHGDTVARISYRIRFEMTLRIIATCTCDDYYILKRAEHKPLPKSPVREVTRHELVAGTYGSVQLYAQEGGTFTVNVSNCPASVADLDAVIGTLSTVRNALKGGGA